MNAVQLEELERQGLIKSYPSKTANKNNRRYSVTDIMKLKPTYKRILDEPIEPLLATPEFEDRPASRIGQTDERIAAADNRRLLERIAAEVFQIKDTLARIERRLAADDPSGQILDDLTKFLESRRSPAPPTGNGAV
jgi:DNA-binding transcriptional MerR regulator